MKNNIKHIALAVFLNLTIQAPYVLQLIHVFDNDHGVVYLDTQNKVQPIPKSNCGIFHQQLHYVFNLETHVFETIHSDIFDDTVLGFTAQLNTHFHSDFSLRAPPV